MSQRIEMENYDQSALALQKNLLTLRQQRDRQRPVGNHTEADHLDKLITGIEQTFAQLQDTFKPTTLQ